MTNKIDRAEATTKKGGFWLRTGHRWVVGCISGASQQRIMGKREGRVQELCDVT